MHYEDDMKCNECGWLGEYSETDTNVLGHDTCPNCESDDVIFLSEGY